MDKLICISGIYPHLAVFNGESECGIGAIVPWAGKLWYMSYSSHKPSGSPDKLYTINQTLVQEIRPESIGGTHAGRLIHRESNQLFIGPYVVDAQGNVRVINIKVLVGRLTAIARHLSDPANLVYYYDMEGRIYEVNVHTLEVKKIFEKPVPGWHGKGAYTGQGRLIVANNGEKEVFGHSYKTLLAGEKSQTEEERGVLAEWNGKEWKIIERKQFTDVTGPGGIFGAPDDSSPIWSIGWDRRSVILKLLDNSKWYSYRLPKASYTYDHKGGWYTEWPRIRAVASDKLMMDMHGMLYYFPKDFNSKNTGDIIPIATHLRMITDFCEWNNTVILASNDTSIMENKMAGQSQSNLWFGKLEDLHSFGPRNGWGGPWVNDEVQAGIPSDPFLLNGFDQKIVHLSHNALTEVNFTLEVDLNGNNQWAMYQTITVPANGYRFHIFPKEFKANWIRITADKNCIASVYFHLSTTGYDAKENENLFISLADVRSKGTIYSGIIRPSKDNRNLQYLAQIIDENGVMHETYYEIDEKLIFHKKQSGAKDVKKYTPEKEFEVDKASVILKYKGQRYRLPKSDSSYDTPFENGWSRVIRECVTERYLLNIHGTIYEKGRESDLPKIKPICTHNKKIMDFCTWRGLLVISGTQKTAKQDTHYLTSGDIGLWFGKIDDLWKFGKPIGKGGPWYQTVVNANAPSDPYLMTGYDRKKVELSHNSNLDILFTIEIDVDHTSWKTYQTISVPSGQTIIHEFPEGFSANWVRVTADKNCIATALFTYE